MQMLKLEDQDFLGEASCTLAQVCNLFIITTSVTEIVLLP